MPAHGCTGWPLSPTCAGKTHAQEPKEATQPPADWHFLSIKCHTAGTATPSTMRKQNGGFSHCRNCSRMIQTNRSRATATGGRRDSGPLLGAHHADKESALFCWVQMHTHMPADGWGGWGVDMIFFWEYARVLCRESFDTCRGGAAPPRSTSKRWMVGMENDKAGTKNTDVCAYAHPCIWA